MFVDTGKPVVIGEFGSQKPMDVRNAFYQALYEEMVKAKKAGLPAAGGCSCTNTHMSVRCNIPLFQSAALLSGVRTDKADRCFVGFQWILHNMTFAR